MIHKILQVTDSLYKQFLESDWYGYSPLRNGIYKIKLEDGSVMELRFQDRSKIWFLFLDVLLKEFGYEVMEKKFYTEE